MNGPQRLIVQRACFVLAAGFFGYSFFVSFLPWLTTKPESHMEYIGKTAYPVGTERPEVPIEAWIYGIGVPVLLVAAGAFVASGGREENSKPK